MDHFCPKWNFCILTCKIPHLSERELAELFKISRNTLTRLINKEEELGETSHTQPPALLTQQAFRDEAHSLLDRCAHLVDDKCATSLKQTSLYKFIEIKKIHMYCIMFH